VPDGETGELLVRGGTLMDGYWGNAEATARSFVSDFLHPHLSDRLYRTGDIVVRQPDGTYAFHGRVDHMVKVRGYRVELGEVEAALLRADGVTEAAVVAVARDGPGGRETELVAFVSGEGPDPGREKDLRRHLASHVLKYMVPAEIRFLKTFPATSSGKTDRQALGALANLSEPADGGRPVSRTETGRRPGDTT
jgi:acyl-coenzyme A synthetase/AMP-(fatty) acid ligase